MSRAVRLSILTIIGGLLYVLIELLWRGYSHWTMFVVGGVCFVLIGGLNEVFTWEMRFWKQCVIGAAMITVTELLAGIVINIWFGWNVWDYSELPLNVLGQICLPFSVLWCFLSAFAIVLDDYLRYWLFGEEKPRYKL